MTQLRRGHRKKLGVLISFAVMLALGILNAGLNLALDFALVRILDLRGIALATTAVHLVIACVFWVAMKRRLERA